MFSATAANQLPCAQCGGANNNTATGVKKKMANPTVNKAMTIGKSSNFGLSRRTKMERLNSCQLRFSRSVMLFINQFNEFRMQPNKRYLDTSAVFGLLQTSRA